MRAMPFVVVCFGFAAMGAAPGEPLRISWSAHDDCPDLNGFWQEISARSSTLRRAQPGEAAHEAKVTITRVGDQSVAAFVLDGGAVRKVSGATCGEAVRALSIVTVIALDGGAHPAPSTSSSTLPLAAPVTSASVLPKPSASVEITPPPPPRPVEPTPHASVTEPRRAWLGVGVGPFAAGTVSTIATSVAVDVERPGGASIRLTLARAESPFIESAAGTGATFTWTTGRLDTCVVPWSLDARFVLRMCAALEGGALQGTPRGASAQSTRVRPWLAAYAIPRLHWSVTSALAFELEGAIGAPYTRDEFTFDPSVVVYRPAAWVARAHLGLLVRFL